MARATILGAAVWAVSSGVFDAGGAWPESDGPRDSGPSAISGPSAVDPVTLPEPGAPIDVSGLGGLRPIQAGEPVRLFRTATDGSEPTGAVATGISRLVYDNSLSTHVIAPPANLVTALLGDDIATTAAFGCNLDRYVVRVTGDQNGDGTVVGDLSARVALYPACPRANVSPYPPLAPIPGTECQFLVPADEANGLIDLTCQIPEGTSVPIPTNLFVGIAFDRGDAGIAIGAPALVGYSVNLFDHPSAACGAAMSLASFEGGGLHASFYGQIYIREPCGRSFITYKNTRQSRAGFSPGGGIRFADDVHLGSSSCNLVAYEVSLKGTITGTVLMDLRTGLSTADPENGLVIPGTRSVVAVSPANQLVIARVEMPTPVALPQDLFISFRTSSASVGPIAGGGSAGLGTTDRGCLLFSDIAWVPSDLIGMGAVDVAIICEGDPPGGACCDMRLTDENGDSVCREVAEMNCPFPVLWEEGGQCESTCVRGPNAGLPCTRQADCPGGTCVGGTNAGAVCATNSDCPGLGGRCARSECFGAFDHPCGDAKCCTADNFCCNLTESQCKDLPGAGCASDPEPDSPILWQRGTFCQEGGDAGRCPITLICGEGRGSCCELGFESKCVGGVNDGAACDPFVGCGSSGTCEGGTSPGAICFVGGTPCPGAGASCKRGYCTRRGPGCEDQACCEAVCDYFDPFGYPFPLPLRYCCESTWDEGCAWAARWLCECPGGFPGDECAGPSAGRGAVLLSVPDAFVGDGRNATTSDADPEFCCYEGPTPNPDCIDGNLPAGCDTECGPAGCGTLWYRFVAPPPQPGQSTSSARVETCGSNPPASDSLIEVFSIPDSDRGQCSDSSVCSGAAQDCSDGSPCVFDEQFACANLTAIACNDDDPACRSDGSSPQPRNSRVCVTGLVPGDLYYVMLAAKTKQTQDDYRIRISSPCTPALPPMPNDLCDHAAPVAGAPAAIGFDLSGGSVYAPATFDCPGPGCIATTLHNDLWYDWVAPASGRATFSTCGDDDATTPDTGLVIYDARECPVADDRVLGCNDFQYTPCFLGAKVADLPVESGRCYKIRLGGDIGGTPAGTLHITFEPHRDCNGNAMDDRCELTCSAPGCDGLECGTADDCNANRSPDECDRADFDGDGRRTLRDLAALQWCFGGGGDGELIPCCQLFDADGDGFVDLVDLPSALLFLDGP